MKFAGKWMVLEPIIPGGGKSKSKDKHSMFLFCVVLAFVL